MLVNLNLETDFDILGEEMQTDVHLVAMGDETVIDIVTTGGHCVAVVND